MFYSLIGHSILIELGVRSAIGHFDSPAWYELSHTAMLICPYNGTPDMSLSLLLVGLLSYKNDALWKIIFQLTAESIFLLKHNVDWPKHFIHLTDLS